LPCGSGCVQFFVESFRVITTFAGNVHRDHARAYYGLLTSVLLHPRFDC